MLDQFDVEAAEPVPILSGRRHLAIPPCGIAATESHWVRQVTDNIAATERRASPWPAKKKSSRKTER